MNINDNIFRDLWDGRICPSDNREDSNEYKNALHQLSVCAENIEKVVAPENKKLIQELSAANTNLEIVAEYRAFECGFRLAVNLLISALGS